MSDIEPFEFDVHVDPHIDWHRDPTVDDIEDYFAVELPHQCDEWPIAWGTREDVIAGIEAFIAEAQVALETLRTLPTCDHDWQPDGFYNDRSNLERQWFRCHSECGRRVGPIRVTA